MSRTLVSIVVFGTVLYIACVSASTPILCGDNEQLGNCGRICEEKCDNQDLSECAATSCSGSGCQCKLGFLRNNETDECVPLSQCPTPKCKANEVLAACGRTCEGTCENPARPEICKRIRCARQGCQCDLSRGYVRDPKTDECVRNQDNKCCADKIKCPANSKPKLCGGVCESTCGNPAEILCKLDPTNCVIACHCSKGFVRNEFTGECVIAKDCPHGTDANPDSSESTGSSESSDSDE